MRAVHLALALAAPALALLQPRTTAELLAEYGAPVPLPPPRYLARNASAPTTLRAAAAARGLLVGAAINQALYTDASEPAYAATFLAEFSLATCENGCKTPATEPQQGQFNFSECSFIADAALNAGKGAFRGHNFVWGVYNPSWISSALGAAGLKQAMATHISTLLAHYAADASLPPFRCWDVVNEAVCDTGSTQYNCTREALWKNVVWSPSGEGTVGGYVENAFTFAHAANSQNVKLFYNDYSAEAAGGVKSDKIYGMLQDMRSRGVPITGVGLQMHISVDGYPDPWAVAANIKRLGELGLEVHITEMDVSCKDCTPARLQLQAAVYGHMLEACLNNSGVCTNFETWGITDKHSWLGSSVSPLLFDETYAKKPAYFELLAVLAQ